MEYQKIIAWPLVLLLLAWPILACDVARQTPMPAPTLDQLVFEIQTATPTVLALASVPTDTPEPTPTLTPTEIITTTPILTATDESPAATPTAPPQEAVVEVAATPTPPPPVATAEPVQGGAWDFEEGFTEWFNPYGDRCPGSGLANGWNAFTSRDQYGSSCMNQTTWKGNVNSGISAQEITFAYVGVQAGIFKSLPTLPGHRYKVAAFMKREFSPAKLEVTLGLDASGGVDWQAAAVQWFPWSEDNDDAWAKTEQTITAAGNSMTIFIKGSHPYPEPGGTLRLDSISISDLGPE
jgi:hypothetical protein